MEDGASFIEEKESSEWGARTISILGAAKSFISQLSVGQDLTKVSLPSVFLYPFSILELGSARFLPYFDVLIEASKHTDPFERFLGVIKYFLTLTQKEKFDKKPYNPILGEMHSCWSETQYGTTRFLAEQVSHHPPVSGCFVQNKEQNVQANYNVTFEIKFHGNSVSIATNGGTKIEFLEHGEEIVISKALPDMLLKNVIIGTKRIVWDGPIVFECQKHGFKATIDFKEEGWYCVNTIYGTLYNSLGTIPYGKLTGACSETINIARCEPAETPEGLVTKTPQVFMNIPSLKRGKVSYSPKGQWEYLSSRNIWKDVSVAIVADDMPAADNAKRLIEEAQRKRRNEGTSYKSQFFKPDETKFWVPVNVDTIFLSETPIAPSQPEDEESTPKESDPEVDQLTEQTETLTVTEQNQ